jgi:hypothetical protein
MSILLPGVLIARPTTFTQQPRGDRDMPNYISNLYINACSVFKDFVKV